MSAPAPDAIDDAARVALTVTTRPCNYANQRVYNAILVASHHCISLANFSVNVIPPSARWLVERVEEKSDLLLRALYENLRALRWTAGREQLLLKAAIQEAKPCLQEWVGFNGWKEEAAYTVQEVETSADHRAVAYELNKPTLESVTTFREERMVEILQSTMKTPMGWTPADEREHIRRALVLLPDPHLALLQCKTKMETFFKVSTGQVAALQALRLEIPTLTFDVTSFTSGANKRMDCTLFPPSYHSGRQYLSGGFIKLIPPGTSGHFLIAMEHGILLLVGGAHQALSLSELWGPILVHAVRLELIHGGIHPGAHPSHHVDSMRSLGHWPSTTTLAPFNVTISTMLTQPGRFQSSWGKLPHFSMTQLLPPSPSEINISMFPTGFMEHKSGLWIWTPWTHCFFLAYERGDYFALVDTFILPHDVFVMLGLYRHSIFKKTHSKPLGGVVNA
jgi:hypothetical protein